MYNHINFQNFISTKAKIISFLTKAVLFGKK